MRQSDHSSHPNPIYNLLHRRIRAIAEELVELSQRYEFSQPKDYTEIIRRLGELLSLAQKMRSEYHHPLLDFRHYLENTMMTYPDEWNQHSSIRLSEAISLLSNPLLAEQFSHTQSSQMLITHFLRFFTDETKPGRPFFFRLVELRKL